MKEPKFVGQIVLKEKLVPFGFRQETDGYYYQKPIMEGDFELEVKIELDGSVSVEVYDTQLNEPYLAWQVSRPSSYAQKVKQAVDQILDRILATCFQEPLLKSGQGQKLLAYLDQTFEDDVDHPFRRYPEFFSYRTPQQKWYALFVTIKRRKLDLGKEKWSETALDDLVEVVNIKVDPEKLPQLLTEKGIYPAYHMNKKSWVSIVLDGSMANAELFTLVTQSRALAGAGTSSSLVPTFWVLPANPSYFDVDAAFAHQDTLWWGKKAQIKKGIMLAFISQHQYKPFAMFVR